MKKIYFILLVSNFLISQNIDVNNSFIYNKLNYEFLNSNIETDFSFNIKPVSLESLHSKPEFLENLGYNLIPKKKNFDFKILSFDYNLEYNAEYPYKTNNGSMLPNRGYQHIFSPGFYLKLGPLSIKIKPEHHYSQNKNYDGFWEGHYPVIWSKRYRLWNHIDMPERFGLKRHNQLLIGQSYIKLNFNKISFGISNENLWWGPSKRNSIMMSNNAQGFKHITLNTNKPINTFFGKFEFQFITGRLEESGYTPPNTDFEYAGTKLYVPKINQNGKSGDWRFLQAYILSFSPKILDGFSLGFVRWVQMYSALVEGKYFWMDGNPNYFPIFNNIFRKNDNFIDYEAQTDQAAGIFFKWNWKKEKTELYYELHYNDAKQNLRDLLLDPSHSKALTAGIQKILTIKNNNYLLNWEFTQMQQTASSILRNSGSWYEHTWVYHGYTNNGEVLGSAIGPGSSSNYFSFSKINEKSTIGIGFEIFSNDDDFYRNAFAGAEDFRRYWKDFNLHLKYEKNYKKFLISTNLIYIRSLNYQWELEDLIEPYFRPGTDRNNFHATIKINYLF